MTEILRATGVVGKFVEYFGPGLVGLPVADRATIANMSPEYGATCGFFPVDDETLTYLLMTGRSKEQIELVETYCREQGLFHEPTDTPTYSQVVELDLGDVVPSLAGPRRPQDRVPLDRTPRLVRGRDGAVRRPVRERLARQGERRLVPRERPARRHRARAARSTSRSRAPAPVAVAEAPAPASVQVTLDDGQTVRARARRGRDRRDHELHEHLEPVGHDRRRPRGEEGGRAAASSASRG